MKKLIFLLICALPLTAQSGVLYSVETVGSPNESAINNEAFASKHRFYAGAMYDFSIWQDYTDDNMIADGKNASGFDIVAGVRVSDSFRIEADYLNTRAKWDSFSLDTNTIFLNALVDARIDNVYRLFHNQVFVPYVGAGVGMTFVSGNDTDVDKDTVASMAAIAGIGIELSETVTFDFGYRYMYMFKPHATAMPDLRPRAHQLRGGIRFNF